MGRLAGIGGDFRQSAKGAFQYKIGTDSLCCLKERKSVSFHSGGYHRPEYLIGSPGVISSRVPHHRAYGSVHGGSD